LNEAFASVVLTMMEELNIPHDRMNVNGGAIAMGHPLGATGAMILGTAPGGIAEMAITAKVLQLGVAVVTAFQVCRLVAVLVLVEPLYKWLYWREGQR